MSQHEQQLVGIVIDGDQLKREKLLDELSDMNHRGKSLKAMFEDHRITLRDFARWLCDREFRRALAELVRAIRKLRELEFERSAFLGALTYLLVVAGHGGFKSAMHKKACAEAYGTASRATQRKAAKIVKEFIKAQQKIRNAPSYGPGGIAHPDVAHIADRLIDELEEARRKDAQAAQQQVPSPREGRGIG